MSVVAVRFKKGEFNSCLQTRRNLRFHGRSSVVDVATPFIRRAFCLELVFELIHETEHRPGAGLAKGTDGPALNIFRDVEQVLGVLGASVSVGEAMEGLAHPERPL